MGLDICGLNLDHQKRELRPHGRLEFPCAGYEEVYPDERREDLPWHWHEEWEIVYIVSGNWTVRIPSKSFSLSKGDLLVINSGVLHSGETDSRCELCSMVFHSRLVTGKEDSVFAKKYLNPLMSDSSFQACFLDQKDAREHALITEFVQAFEALAKDRVGHEFQIRNILSLLCLEMYRRFEETLSLPAPRKDSDDIRIRSMLDYIHEHYGEDILLTDIAEAAAIGERECLRCFQKTIQVSPIQYLLKYRVMAGAQKLLACPTDSIADIASACGFDSPSNFSKLFKRYYKCTPRVYRKKGEKPMGSDLV